MSDGISRMWYEYEEYVELCKKLYAQALTIDEDWLSHRNELIDND